MALSGTYEELRTPRYKLSRENQEASRLIWVPTYSDLNAIYLSVFPEAVGGNPQAADTMPGFPWLVASDMTVDAFVEEKLDSATPPTCPRGAKVEIVYKAKPFTQSTGGSPYQQNSDLPGAGVPGSKGPGGPGSPANQNTFISYEMDAGAQFVTIKDLGLVWDVDNKPVGPDAKTGVVELTLEHTITWHHCPLPPWGALRRCLGHVNTETFCGALPETLLLSGVKGKREIGIGGTRAWELVFKFSERNLGVANGAGGEAAGWNHYYWSNNTAAAGYYRVRRRGSNDGAYLKSVFDNLFVPGGA